MGWALSSRIRQGRSLWPSITGCSASTCNACARFGSRTGCAVRWHADSTISTSAEDAERAEDHKGVVLLCVLCTLCGESVVVAGIGKELEGILDPFDLTKMQQVVPSVQAHEVRDAFLPTLGMYTKSLQLRRCRALEQPQIRAAHGAEGVERMRCVGFL